MVKKEDLVISTLCALASVLDAKDHYTEGHSHQVAVYSVALARALSHVKSGGACYSNLCAVTW